MVTAVLVAGMIRRRDRQVPTDLPGFTADDHLSGIPEQGGPLRVRGAAGRVRRDRD